MKPWSPKLAAALAIVVAVAGLSAAPARVAPLAFTVSTPDPASHLFHVRLRCQGLTGDTVEFRMPVWTPGYYGLFDFAGNVRNFSATDDAGRALRVEKNEASDWTVRTRGATTAVIAYDVLATKPFVANAFLDESRGYITPGALFVYVPGQLRRPATVTIELNRAWSTVATGLDPLGGPSTRTYAAADFDVLYDSPILMGNLESLPTFDIKGVPHRFIGYGLGEFDRQQFVDDLRAVVKAGTDIIGDIPYGHYTFIGIGPGRGGIEHANSAAVSFSGVGSNRAARIRTLSFLAHEYFHTYNVKRIRPIALGPFDYARPNVTDMLWVSEGFTVYYEYLMMARSGRMTQEELLEALSRTIAACENNSGRLFQSVTASSRETWRQGPFGRSGSGLSKTISYYDKGAVLGLLLDLRIRHDTNNRNSLDTLMRALYRKYYKQLGRGWTDAEFQRACEEVAGTGLNEIFEYASTTRPVDYPTFLAYAGLQLEQPRPLGEADLGALVEDVNGAATVAAVEPASAAARAGIAAGDVVVSLDGKAVTAATLPKVVAERKPGSRVRIVARRGDGEQSIDAVLDARMERTWRMTPIWNPSALQAAILAGLTSADTTGGEAKSPAIWLQSRSQSLLPSLLAQSREAAMLGSPSQGPAR